MSNTASVPAIQPYNVCPFSALKNARDNGTTRTTDYNSTTSLQTLSLHLRASNTKATPLILSTQHLLTHLPCCNPNQVRKPSAAVKLDFRDYATFCTFPDLEERHGDSGTHGSTHGNCDR